MQYLEYTKTISYNVAIVLGKKVSIGNSRRSSSMRASPGNTTSYNAAFSACEHWELALGLLNESKTLSTPNIISHNAAIVFGKRVGVGHSR